MAFIYPSNQQRIGVGPGPYLVGQKVETNKQSGNKTTWTYEGTIAELQGQRATDLMNGAASTTINEKGDGNWRLESVWNYDAGFSGGSNGANLDEPANVHDLEISMETVSAYNSPKLYAFLLAAFGGADSSVQNALATVKKAVQAFHAGDPKINVAANSPEAKIAAEKIIADCYPNNPNNAQALMISLFHEVALMGVETVVQYNSVYRRSITAASPNQVLAARAGEGMIWTSAEISAFENLPAFWWFQLPTGKQWLKNPANVSMVAGGKTRIDYTYLCFARASSLHYDAYGSAVLFTP